jgi:hypothetical protein
MKSALSHRFVWLIATILAASFAMLLIWPLAAGELAPDRLNLVAVNPQLQIAQGAAGLPDGTIESAGVVLLQVPVPLPIGLLSFAGPVAWLLAAAFAGMSLYRLFSDFARDRVFEARNPRRLIRSGWVLVAAELVRIAATMIQDRYVEEHVIGSPWLLAAQSDRDIHLVFFGLLLVGLGSAFRAAVRMREEIDLTV